LFGVPLGIGGVAALFGFLVALAGLLASYFVFAGALAISGILMIALGASRIYLPGLWDRLVETGILQIDSGLERVLALGDAGAQGFIILLAGSALVAAAVALFYFGRGVFRGISNLAVLLLDRARKAATRIRKYWTSHGNHMSFRHVTQRI
jgi:ABC-type multidrug transport system fused ATPase/permease subunit